MEALTTGLAGLGFWGPNLARNFAELGQLAWLCDSDQSKLEAVRQRFPSAQVTSRFGDLLEDDGLAAVAIATPVVTHFDLARQALLAGKHVFVEKPLCLDPLDSRRLADLARTKRRANQVGYHHRFIGTFQETRRLVRAGALGEVYHISGSAFGPVVTRPKSGSTWRSRKSEGGGCLHDYASHVVDLMNLVVGPPERILGAHLRRIHSRDVEDAVYATFRYPGGASGQLETNWSDDTHRKMSTTITVYGTRGKIVADRQECKIYLRPGADFEQYPAGWTIRYITDLQAPVAYYLRGEEYTAQVDTFLDAVDRGTPDHENSFASAGETDRVIDMIAKAAQGAG